jgi:hypothetical protein
MGTPRAHLDDGTPPSGGHHPGGRGGDGAVVVEHAEDERLEDDALGEAAADGQDRRAREEQFAFGVPVDVSGEAVVGEPLRRTLIGPALAQEGDLLVAETEIGDQLQQAGGTGDYAVAAAAGQAAAERLEHAGAVGRAILQGGTDHGQFVLVREESR